jgi:hypothetical protein
MHWGMSGYKVCILCRTNVISSGIVHLTIHLVGVAFIARTTQNQQPRQTKTKATNQRCSSGKIANILIGSPVGNKQQWTV